MPLEARTRITDLVQSLANYNGFRSIWTDVQGQLLHCEPDDDLGHLGCTYRCTVMQPDFDNLSVALGYQEPAQNTSGNRSRARHVATGVFQPVMAG